MFKRLCYILLLLFSIVNVSAQTFWHTLRLSEKVTVNFPKAPGKSSGISYGCIDSTGMVFAASVSDIAKAINFNKSDFDSVVVEREFANDFQEGFKPSIPDYVLKPITISTLTGNVTYQFEGRSEAKKSNIYFLALFIDGKAYNFTCILPDGKSVRDKNLFFKGISISK